METRCHGAKTEFHFTSLVYRGQPTVKPNMVNVLSVAVVLHFFGQASGAPNDNFRKIICSEDDLRSRIFGSFSVKFLACLLLLGFSNIKKMV